MTTANGDRNLLFGILALQMDFIKRDALVQAMHAWILDKAKPLSQILVEQGTLSAARRALLEPLVQEHIQQHGGDAGKSLAAVSSVGSAREVLKQIADPDVQASLVNLPTTDPNATKYPSAGNASAVGRRFLILRPHAEGGLGKVSVALDGELNREVALKEIHEQYADHSESRSRFLLEAEITGGLEHPSIVPVYGLGKYEDGRPFYAMRFIKGDSLKEAVERFHKSKGPINAGKRALELRQLLGRFNDVCDAVAYAHSRGVLHRDLKPGNVMLGKYGETLVVDWGLAKPAGAAANKDGDAESPLQPSSADDSAPTQMGSAIGTPQFMPPEQAAGRLDQMGPASDVYSLGATLYCLLTGKPPFTDRDVGVVLQKVQRGDFPPPRQVRREIPPALEAICLKAMALRPEARYPTARALANDIEKWLADEPVSAYREPWRVRAGRWVRRNQTMAAATAAGLLVALLAGGAGALWYQHDRAVRATERANKASATERDVTAALDEATALGKQAARLRDDPLHWAAALSEALSAAKRADGVLNSGVDDAGQLRRRADAVRGELEAEDKDRRMVARLEEARLQGAAAGRENGFDAAGSAALYSAAFEEDMRLHSLSAEQAAQGVNKRAIREELLASMADWFNITTNQEDQQRLRGILQAADPDAATFRNRWDAAVAEKDQERLRRLAFNPEADNQPAVMVVLLGRQLTQGNAEDGVKFLRAANERRPGDFWILFELANACQASRPPLTDEAMRFYTAALALRPGSNAAHNNLGYVLYVQGKRGEAAAEFRKAIHIDPNAVAPHNGLGSALFAQDNWEEAAVEFRTAIRLDPMAVAPHSNLGFVLRAQSKWDEATAEFRKAIQLDPKEAKAHTGLANVLSAQSKGDEAVAEYRKAIHLDPKVPNAHIGLGAVLAVWDEWEEAVAEYRAAIQLDPKLAEPHTALGTVLAARGKREEAAAEYRQGAQLGPGEAQAHTGLGNVLAVQGKWEEAAAEYRKAIELDPATVLPRTGLGNVLSALGKWDEAAAEYRETLPLIKKLPANDPTHESVPRLLHKCEENVALDKKLQAVLKGDVRPADAREQVKLAELCHVKKRYAVAAHFYAAAFAATPALADDLQAGSRYDAACNAVLAAAGQGQDADKLDDTERGRLRQQALDWLRADQAMWGKQEERGAPQARASLQETLQHWQDDSDLISVRDAAALNKLPESERAEWKKLWADVEEMLKRNGESGKP